ncbi:hypothetical protein [Candidatus Cryosericum septentrionale]|jgi:hypothetical protein|uniref:RNA polymerase sigma-70 region 4 domain-containing protein n=1 Tax=Candidatus Cryosericum septentrionale TaxID=2290913 RepID=A0A398DRW9_9BACT|nr:hypothetical protein [Candidatus Cryosericum septentrionale]RIE17670.1 hypothetical protein SMC1_00360 [Candidatus Cryosericum septentrionale]
MQKRKRARRSLGSRSIFPRGADWSVKEVGLVVSDYFEMLQAETRGKQYVKVDHLRALKPLLNHRSKGSIEFKYANISAVFRDLGQSYLAGYKPRANYQKLLTDVVKLRLNVPPQHSLLLSDRADAPTADSVEVEPGPLGPGCPASTVLTGISQRSELSCLVEECGDITSSRLSTLDEMSTRAVVSAAFPCAVFPGADGEIDIEDASAIVEQAAVGLYLRLRRNVTFRGLLQSMTRESDLSVAKIEAKTLEGLSDSDPGRQYVGSFAAVVALVVRVLGVKVTNDTPLLPEARVLPETQKVVNPLGTDAGPHETLTRAELIAREKRSRLEQSVRQLPLDVLLAEYCDFSASKAPSVSPADLRCLHARYGGQSSLNSIGMAEGVTRERIRQRLWRGSRLLMEDLLMHVSFQDYWRGIHEYSILSPEILEYSVLGNIGDMERLVDAKAIGRLFMDALGRERGLARVRLGTTSFQCCPQAEEKLEELLTWVQHEALSDEPHTSGLEERLGQYLASNAVLPQGSTSAVTTELVTALPRESLGDQIETALKQLQAPAHFADLARYLEAKGIAQVDPRRVESTLGRDSRFSWAGLGTWALRSWGYPPASESLDVVLYLIRKKGGGVTFDEICEFMFMSHAYAVKRSSVLIRMKIVEGGILKRVGASIWDEM